MEGHTSTRQRTNLHLILELMTNATSWICISKERLGDKISQSDVARVTGGFVGVWWLVAEPRESRGLTARFGGSAAPRAMHQLLTTPPATRANLT